MKYSFYTCIGNLFSIYLLRTSQYCISFITFDKAIVRGRPRHLLTDPLGGPSLPESNGSSLSEADVHRVAAARPHPGTESCGGSSWGRVLPVVLQEGPRMYLVKKEARRRLS